MRLSLLGSADRSRDFCPSSKSAETRSFRRTLLVTAGFGALAAASMGRELAGDSAAARRQAGQPNGGDGAGNRGLQHGGNSRVVVLPYFLVAVTKEFLREGILSSKDGVK
ncbi:hypothetical protein HNP55_004622 [Paucibacter oligotrophus]|uniref:Uncharacterized protein n=1 Tax=Roseateles oligotrophus TaxID=1769250 RepID=A0A840LIN6_9BURK|nr:hypothetical protein [Roseateles oligotrophus]MBB4846068.1 hypothetical protein [Roseateles oligotrophus]